MLNRFRGIYLLPRMGRFAFAHDLFMASAAFLASLYLRLGDSFFTYPLGEMTVSTGVFVMVCGGTFLLMRLYRGIWRYASLRDLIALTKAVTLAILVFIVLMFTLTRLEMVPRSLPFITWFVLMAFMGGPRFLYRVIRDRRFDWSLGSNGKDDRIPILLVGAGDGAELFLRALGKTQQAGYKAVGIVSKAKVNVGRAIHGVSVMGTFDAIGTVTKKLDAEGLAPRRLVLTQGDLDGETVRKLLDAAEINGMTLARMPQVTDFRAEGGGKAEIRPVDVEDLLGRAQQPLDRTAMRDLIVGRRVLITGAGGSIGSELVRQVSSLGPAEIGLLDNSEFNLYTVDMEAGALHADLPRRLFLADVRDRARIMSVMQEFRPELVFHAAALKHVPMVELNPEEGIFTNVTGTVNVADACRDAGVGAMIMISTDKAINPTNVMGATKRIAERYCQALDLEDGVDTHYVTVRFGNVLGSTGSVVPLFQKQLANGGPLTVTHPDMTRYFMTIREAVKLVLLASAIGSRGREQEGKIFVLDMGSPVKILDLARQMIRLQGLEPDRDIEIKFTGVRPGEKLFEEVFHGGETLVSTDQPGILLAAPRSGVMDELGPDIRALEEACLGGDKNALQGRIRRLVPEYQPELAGASGASEKSVAG